MNKDLLKIKNYIFPEYLIPILIKYKLNINEMLLLLVFLNGEKELDLNRLTKITKLSEQDIMYSFNNFDLPKA